MNRRTFFGGLMAGLAALCGVKPKRPGIAKWSGYVKPVRVSQADFERRMSEAIDRQAFQAPLPYIEARLTVSPSSTPTNFYIGVAETEDGPFHQIG
jgi:hypothetical protein